MPKDIFPYLRGLLQGHKITATFLASQFGYSHDALTRTLRRTFHWEKYFLLLVQRLFGSLSGGYLIIDDTVLAKPYGRAFQEATFAFSSSFQGVIYGYHIVLLAWTDGVLTLPLSWRFYRKGEKSKVSLAAELLREACQRPGNSHPRRCSLTVGMQPPTSSTKSRTTTGSLSLR